MGSSAVGHFESPAELVPKPGKFGEFDFVDRGFLGSFAGRNSENMRLPVNQYLIAIDPSPRNELNIVKLDEFIHRFHKMEVSKIRKDVGLHDCNNHCRIAINTDFSSISIPGEYLPAGNAFEMITLFALT